MSKGKQKKRKPQQATSTQSTIDFSADDVFAMMNDTSQLVAQENVTRLSSTAPAASESGVLTDSVEFWSWMDRNFAKSGHFSSPEKMQATLSSSAGQRNWAKTTVQGKGYEWDWMTTQRKSFKNLFKSFDAGDIANRPGSDITAHDFLSGADKEYQLKAYTSKNTPHLKNTPKDMAVVTNAEKVDSVSSLGYDEVISFGDVERIEKARDARLDAMAEGKASPVYTVKNVSIAMSRAGMTGFVLSASVEAISSYRSWKAGKISAQQYLKEVMKSGGNAGITASFSSGIMIPITATITTAGISSIITIPIAFTVSAAVDKIIAPAFARGDYAIILKEAKYYSSLTEYCCSLAYTMNDAAIQYESFVNQMVAQQEAFNKLSGGVISQQAIEDFEFYAGLSKDEVSAVVSAMIALLKDTDNLSEELQNQACIQRMIKTVTGKNKATVAEIRSNYDRLTVYVSKAIEALYNRQRIDQKVIQILAGEILEVCKNNVALTSRVQTLESRVDSIQNAVLFVSAPGDVSSVVSVKEIADASAVAAFREAERLFIEGKLIEAFSLFLRASDCGVPKANYYVAEYYSNGYGHIKESFTSALQYYKQGMDLGDPLCTYKYGETKYDANEYQLKSWKRQHIKAVFNQTVENDPAAIYEYGWYVLASNPSDVDTLVDSLGYFKKSANAGFWPGALQFYQYTEDLRQSGTLLPDYTEMFENVEYYGAQLMAGMAKLTFSPRDYEESARHFQKALWLRDDIPEPAAYLAFLLSSGLIKDSLKDGLTVGSAPMYYSAGLYGSQAITLFQVGQLYFQGIDEAGRGKDMKKAYEYLERCYQKTSFGFIASQLGYMCLVGDGHEQDYALAFQYLSEGYSHGDPEATRLLAQCYLDGMGTKQDRQRYQALMAEHEKMSFPEPSTVLQAFLQLKLTETKAAQNL